MNGFSFQFEQPQKNIKARLGTIVTPHGEIQTPAFVPVGTQAAVKSLTPDELHTLGVQLFFVNTYHTYLRPGLDVITRYGGLHTFMGWNGPIITDSGGFQVFSLGRRPNCHSGLDPESREKNVEDGSRLAGRDDKKILVAIDEDGVTFTSHWDGTKHRFTPEKSIEIQHALGSDIMIAFDECAPYPTTHDYAKAAMERTNRWAKRSLDAHKKNNTQALYGVIQGSIYEDLRVVSAKIISSMKFHGIAIGGVSVGESKKEMADVLRWVTPHIPMNKPRHLLGVGEIDDIFVLIEQGMDTFDCVQPTRLARMGKLYAKPSDIDIMKKEYEKDVRSIDTSCSCYTCRNFSRGYLHHLFRARELLGYRLATIHNIHFITALVSDIRFALGNGTFLEMKQKWLYNGYIS